MSTAWCILTDRYGADTRDPTFSQIAEAARRLYHEDEPRMVPADYEEHGAASLRYGYDDGPMYVIDASRTRQVTLSKFADQDFEETLSEVVLENVGEQDLVQLWDWLRSGKLTEFVKSYPSCHW